MKESQFINQNIESWRELESILGNKNADPKKLQELFIKVSEDLSYARTFYPRRSVKIYLNSLVSKVYDEIQTRQKYNFKKTIRHFYLELLPEQIIQSRGAFIAALSIFVLSMTIGVFSTMEDITFANDILGSDYVEMTEANIDMNDPMAVYKKSRSDEMFLAITNNNIRVAFFAFVLGFLGGIGTFFILIKNGIMVGAFQAFFIQKGLFWASFGTIWIHGTIEISSIIIAGAAGIIIGNGIVFPGAYTRLTSMKIAAIRALIVILSTTPLFIMAGFLESFVTRLTDMPDLVKIVIIGLSLLFILSVYVIYPYNYYKKGKYKGGHLPIKPSHSPPLPTQTSEHSLDTAGLLIGQRIGPLFSRVILPGLLIFIIMVYIHATFIDPYALYTTQTELFSLSISFSPWLFLMLILLLVFLQVRTALVLYHEDSSLAMVLRKARINLIPISLISVLITIGIYYFDQVALIFLLLLLPITGIAKSLHHIATKDKLTMSMLGTYCIESYTLFIKNFVATMSVVIILFVIQYVFTNLAVVQFMSEMLNWHQLFESVSFQNTIISKMSLYLMYTFIGALALSILNIQHTRSKNLASAADLRKEFEQFGLPNKNIEL